MTKSETIREKIPRFMLAAPKSGSGKTMITCGILAAFKERGHQPVSFKCGPDYIDPLFHQQVLGLRSYNLDTWFAPGDQTRELFCRHSRGRLAVIEGVMGYYDGMGGTQDTASTYEAAAVTKTPVILIVDAKGASLSLIPLIKGFLEYRKDSRIEGVIFNRMSPMLYQRIAQEVTKELQIPVFGYVPELSDHAWKSRHLGLYLPWEIENMQKQLKELGQTMEKTLDLDGILALAKKNEDFTFVREREESGQEAKDKKEISIAFAKDEAFCFTYPENLELLEEMGARLVPFSPLKDPCLPEGTCGLILSGGYPELYGEALSKNRTLLDQIRERIKAGMPCIAECGGFLYLHQELLGEDGKVWPMAGVFGGRVYRKQKLERFGYVWLEARKDQLLLLKGEKIKAHEFHYYESPDCGEACLAKKPAGSRQWSCVHGSGTFYAGFPHLFLPSHPQAARRFVDACGEWEKNCGGKEKLGRLILVTGGSGSGKSEYAENLLCRMVKEGKSIDSGSLSGQFYIATMKYNPEDPECVRRIRRHQKMRGEKGFETLECPTGLWQLAQEREKELKGSAVLLECMSNLVANEMFDQAGAGEDTCGAVIKGVKALASLCSVLVIVTNEVFSDGIRYDDMTENYKKNLAFINQSISSMADEVTEVVYSIPVEVKRRKKP